MIIEDTEDYTLSAKEIKELRTKLKITKKSLNKIDKEVIKEDRNETRMPTYKKKKKYSKRAMYINNDYGLRI